MRRSTRMMAAAGALALTALSPPRPDAIDLPGARAFPESLSIASDGTAYVGSLSGGVLRVTLATGRIEQWIKPGDFGSASTFGVLADEVNGLLWVCSNDLRFAGVTIAGADEGSWLKGFDLATGQGKVSLRLSGERPFCNDMAVARDGTLYVTDTTASRILKLPSGGAALEDWHHDPAYATAQGGGLDGIAFGGDGHLYVNNFQSHVMARVEMKPDGTPGGTTVLKTSSPLDVPDGLRALGGMRFAQAEAGGKVTIVTVEGDSARIETIADGLSSPTSADGHGDTIWYVQGEVSHVFNPALRDKTPPLPFRLTPIGPDHTH